MVDYQNVNIVRTIWQTWFRYPSVARWETIGVLFINLVGGFLHFAFELSDFARPVALFASVNESTWEHLKFYFWAGVLFALIEYTYVRKDADNFIYAKAMGLLVTPIVVSLSFYTYVGIMVPLYGEGTFFGAVATGVIGVIAGQLVSSYYLQRGPLKPSFRLAGAGILLVLIIMFSTFTYYPPKLFLFEDFFGYVYTGQYGILEDYEPYRVFR